MSFGWFLQIPEFFNSFFLIFSLYRSIQSYFRNDPYQILSNDIQLEILDAKGQVARYQKKKRIRFLQNNIFAFLDTAFGSGKIFEDYQCSPGKAVDFYEEGDRYRILISLRKMTKRGDEEVFYVNRTIRKGYTEDTCYLQTDIAYQTKNLEMRVIFPRNRSPKSTWLIHKNTKLRTKLNQENIQFLPDGRCQVIWQKKNPRLYEGYILTWEW